MSTSTLYVADCRDVLRTLPDASVHAVVTDPPYELGFMGKGWDASGIAYDVDLWRECLRVLKPGGHLLAFGGTRTWHRLVVAIEDAGFEIRDSITWLYGSGFPKSLDVSKAIDKAAGAEREVIGVGRYANRGRRTDNTVYSQATASTGEVVTAPATDDSRRWAGWGTALKPASEPICVARKPLSGTVAATVLEYGTGALNVDACRVEGSAAGGTWGARQVSSVGYGGGTSGNDYRTQAREVGDGVVARWPTNVVLTHAADCGPESDPGECAEDCPVRLLGDPSRFFPTFRYEAKAPSRERPKVDGMAHPTVKPLALIRWLMRLVTAPGGVVLDPFLGSGTAAEAAALEGFDLIGAELTADYLPLIAQRLDRLDETARPVVEWREAVTLAALIAEASVDELAALWRDRAADFTPELIDAAGERYRALVGQEGAA